MDNNKDYNSEFKGVWIPKEYLALKLNDAELLVLSVIWGLDNENGCYAKNKRIGKMVNKSEGRISKIIKSLEGKELITCLYDYKNNNPRTIFINNHSHKRPRHLDVKGYSHSHKRPRHLDVNDQYNNRKDYNKNINTPSLTFLKENDFSKYESLKDKYKDQINNWSDFRDAFNSQCELEEIPFEVNKISARLEKYARWWVKNEKPIKKDVIKNIDPEKINESFEWFMNMFNRVSNRNFKGTTEIKELWKKQVKNGFTGKEMQLAVKNLYHPLNEWYKKRKYEFATPIHLLKDDNLNRLINFEKPKQKPIL